MQAHEGLLAGLSLCPSTPDTAEQGLGPRGGFQLSFKGWSRGSSRRAGAIYILMELSRALSSVLILIWGFLGR